jgi:hypothetical protein
MAKASIFGWLFGKKSIPASHEATNNIASPPNIVRSSERSKRIEIRDEGDGWLSIPAKGFYGAYVRSPNGRFRIAWRDPGPDSNDGEYMLIAGDQIICRGHMERPQDGKVADNGVFILNDWRASSDLTGTFRAFGEDGSVVLAQDFAANLFNNGLSQDGQLAACQTCNSDDENDSAILAVFDLTRGKELYRFRAESGWPSTYAFSPDGQTLTLGYPNGEGEFAYSLDGAFLDRDVWIAARLRRGDLLMVRRVIDEAGGRFPVETARQLLEAVNRGLVERNSQDRRWQAFGFRLQGELHEMMGERQAALESYDYALALDAKIGVKQRAAQLRKAMSAPPKL